MMLPLVVQGTTAMARKNGPSTIRPRGKARRRSASIVIATAVRVVCVRLV